MASIMLFVALFPPRYMTQTRDTAELIGHTSLVAFHLEHFLSLSFSLDTKIFEKYWSLLYIELFKLSLLIFPGE